MNKIFFLGLLFFSLFPKIAQKSVIIPLADAYPARYNYHTEFLVDRFDVSRKWICRGIGSFRFQHSFHDKEMASILFQNPLFITKDGVNNTYNGEVLGLGFQTCSSKSNLKCTIINDFITGKVEISRINSPFYLQLGFPIQRSNHFVTMTEKGKTDNKVIKGGFAREYRSTDVPNVDEWKNTPSSIITAIKSMKEYLKGKIIGNMEPRYFGVLTEEHMTLWSLADIYIQLGHEGIHTANSHFGLYIKGIIPTSPSLKERWNKYIFYPTIGNVNRGEIGGGINGHYLFSDSDATSMKLYIDGYGGYLFSARHLRPYDFKNGFFSRYGGIKVFDPYSLTYKNRLLWGVDLTTLEAEIGSCFKSEIVLDLIYQKFQSFFNLGYSLKTQSQENIKTPKDLFLRMNNAYATAFQTPVQSPNPTTQNSWTTDLVTPHSSLSNLSTKDQSIYQENNISGIPMTSFYRLNEDHINHNSGVMNAQVLNIIFAGYTYQQIQQTFLSNLSIKGAVGLSPVRYYTPEFWEFLISYELLY